MSAERRKTSPGWTDASRRMTFSFVRVFPTTTISFTRERCPSWTENAMSTTVSRSVNLGSMERKR
jgi:hypothetical protein